MKIEEKLAKLRKSKGLSQEELAEKLGVSRQAVSRWELGNTTPDIPNLIKLSVLYQVSADYLIHDDYYANDENLFPQKGEGDPMEENGLKFAIRNCRIEDAEALQKLNREDLGYDYPVEKLREKLETVHASKKDRIWVAVMGEQVVGYIHACDYDVIYAPHMKNIMGIAVSSACRRVGIGRALLHAVEEWGKEDDAAGIRLVSGADRVGAHAFYRSCGYDGGKTQLNFKKYL